MAAPALTQADPMLQPTFFEVSPHLMDGSLSPLLYRVPEVQVSKRPAEDAHPPPHCPTQLALSPLASQLSSLHW